VLSKDSGQRSNGPLTRSIFQRGLGPLVIAQHKLLGIGMQVDLLVYPVGNRVAVQVMLQQRNLHLQGSSSRAARPFPGQLVQRLRLSFCVISGKLEDGVSFPGSRPLLGFAHPKDTPLPLSCQSTTSDYTSYSLVMARGCVTIFAMIWITKRLSRMIPPVTE